MRVLQLERCRRRLDRLCGYDGAGRSIDTLRSIRQSLPSAFDQIRGEAAEVTSADRLGRVDEALDLFRRLSLIVRREREPCLECALSIVCEAGRPSLECFFEPFDIALALFLRLIYGFYYRFVSTRLDTARLIFWTRLACFFGHGSVSRIWTRLRGLWCFEAVFESEPVSGRFLAVCRFVAPLFPPDQSCLLERVELIV